MTTRVTRLGLLLLAGLATKTARGDMASLQVLGPHSGTGFSNLAAISQPPVATALTSAEVLIEIQGRKGDDLLATCSAIFDFDTDPGPPAVGQTVLVAFPVTGFGEEGVKISEFEVVVNGTRKSGLLPTNLHLFVGDSTNGRTRFAGEATSIEGSSDDIATLGYRLFGPGSYPDKVLQAYVWTQTFMPGRHCRVEIKYLLTLHAQSLSYAKKYIKGGGWNVVPFDAMLVGTTDEKAYFLDYILRSGATWKGPIGHERITFKAASTSGFTLPLGFLDGVVTFGRHAFERPADLREGSERAHALVHATGVSPANGSLTWEINNEKPTQDILIEISMDAVKAARELGGR